MVHIWRKNNMKKKILILFVSLFAITLVTACDASVIENNSGNNSNTNSNSNSNSTNKKTKKVYQRISANRSGSYS